MTFTRVIYAAVETAAVTVVLAGDAGFFWVTRALWQVPSGSDIDTMGLGGPMLMLGIATPVAAMIVNGAAPDRPKIGNRSVSISEAATAASLGILGLAFFYVPLVAHVRGLHAGP